MIKIELNLHNLTTYEEPKSVVVPISETELKSKLMPDCEYYVQPEMSELSFKAESVFTINKIISLINDENPLMTEEILGNLLCLSGYNYVDDDEFLKKVCENDFMYIEITNAPLFAEDEDVAAYILYNTYDIPFSVSDIEIEMVEDSPLVDGYWYCAWETYYYMGFRTLSYDNNNKKRIVIANLEDAKEE